MRLQFLELFLYRYSVGGYVLWLGSNILEASVYAVDVL